MTKKAFVLEYFMWNISCMHVVKFTKVHGVFKTLIFLKDSIAQIDYIGMAYGIFSSSNSDMDYSMK